MLTVIPAGFIQPYTLKKQYTLAKFKPWQWLLIGGGALLGYNLLRKWQIWDQLEISIDKIVPAVSAQGIILNCTFTLHNKTQGNLTISSIEGWINLQNTRVAQLTTQQSQQVPPGFSNFNISLRPLLGGSVKAIQQLITSGNIKDQLKFNGVVNVVGLPPIPVNNANLG